MFIVSSLGLLILAAWLSTRLAAIYLNRRFPPLGTFVDVHGARLHVLDLPAISPDADPADPAIILLHGASGNLRDPLHIMGRTLNTRYRVILMDRPGQGHSEKRHRSQSDPRIQADITADLMDRLNVKRAVVVGHSWGGAVAAAFGYQHPEKAAALVFISPAAYPWPGGTDWHYRFGSMPVVGRIFAETLAFPVGIALVPCALRSIFGPGDTPPDYRSTVGAAMVLRPKSFVANCQDIADLFKHLNEMQLRYCDIAAPTEIITGVTDNIVAPAIHSYGLVRDIRGAGLTMLDGVGHMPQWNDPEATLAVIERAIGRSRKQTGSALSEAEPALQRKTGSDTALAV